MFSLAHNSVYVNADFGIPTLDALPFSTVDTAFEAGRTAALESGFDDVLPPQGYTAAEVEAFHQGAVEGYRELEWEMEEARKATATTWEEFEPILTVEGSGGFLGHDD